MTAMQNRFMPPGTATENLVKLHRLKQLKGESVIEYAKKIGETFVQEWIQLWARQPR